MISREVRQRVAWSTTPGQLRSLLASDDWQETEAVMAYILKVKGAAVLWDVIV